MASIAIIGLGYVGSAYQRLFPQAVVYDPANGYKDKKTVNRCDLAIVCVPTPAADDGSCDTSLVEETVAWLKTPVILIKSTVTPGTTRRLKRKYHKRICHSPEYIGEGKYYVAPWKYPHPTDVEHHTFVIIGGDRADRAAVIDAFLPRLGPDKVYFQTDETTSELIKYAENAWGATKVTFCNELYSIAEKLGVDYAELREGLLLDSRIERMHTAVFRHKRGFGGRCYPKDVSALVKFAEKAGYEPKLIKQVLASNEEFVKLNGNGRAERKAKPLDRKTAVKNGRVAQLVRASR